SQLLCERFEPTARRPPFARAVGAALGTDVRVAQQVPQRARIPLLGFPGRIQDRPVLVIRDRLAQIATVFSFTADRHLVWIDRRVDPAVRGDGEPLVAGFDETVGPGAVAGVDEAAERSIQRHRVMRRKLGRAGQKFGDRGRFAAALGVDDEGDRRAIRPANPAIDTGPATDFRRFGLGRWHYRPGSKGIAFTLPCSPGLSATRMASTD